MSLSERSIKLISRLKIARTSGGYSARHDMARLWGACSCAGATCRRRGRCHEKTMKDVCDEAESACSVSEH